MGIDQGHTPIMEETASLNNIADLYQLVKTYNAAFTPTPEGTPAPLNKDGTPKNIYHSSNVNGIKELFQTI